jgi:hypothetical protein
MPPVWVQEWSKISNLLTEEIYDVWLSPGSIFSVDEHFDLCQLGFYIKFSNKYKLLHSTFSVSMSD